MARNARVCRGLYFVRSGLGTLLGAAEIQRLCLEAGHRWRAGVLDPVTTIHVFLLQVLHGNTACSHLRHLSGLSFTTSGYCQARRRLPVEFFERVLRRVIDSGREMTASIKGWRGHRVFIADGTSFSMPDSPELMGHFGHPTGQKRGCAFPVAHLLAMCDMATGMLVEVIDSRGYTHDMAKATQANERLRPGDLLLADRSYGNWGYLAMAMQHGLEAVVRAAGSLQMPRERGSRWSPSRKQYRLHRLGRGDQVIEWFKPKACPRCMDRDTFDALAPSICVRVIRYQLKKRGFRTKEVTVLTTLTDPEKYAAADIAELYGRRWEIETNFRHLKGTMGMRVLRCRTVAGVRKELIMYAIAYNLVRLTMFRAGQHQSTDAIRISLIDALRWLRCVQRPGRVPRSSRDGMHPAPLLVNPRRPGRFEPRMTKRRPQQMDYLTMPRSAARKRLMGQNVAA